jgi:hypothetical protein
VLVEAIRTKRQGNSEFLSIVNEIILITLPCANFEVKFVMRQVNSVAHILVRAANFWSSFHRFEFIPCILHLWSLMKCIKFVWLKEIKSKAYIISSLKSVTLTPKWQVSKQDKE